MTIIYDIGVRVVRRAPFLRPTAKWLYSRASMNRIDTPTSWLDTFFSGEPQVTFIQIGAFDGIAGDPIRPLILRHKRWCGVMIEPMPAAFERLTKNYADQSDRLRFLNCAVSNSPGNIEMYEINDEEFRKCEFPSWAPQIASVSEEHIKKHFPHVEIQKRTVPGITISDVFRSLELSRVDLLVMDVEGYERELILGLEFDTLALRVMLFEHKHLSESDKRQVFGHLESFGYAIRAFSEDTIAYRNQL